MEIIAYGTSEFDEFEKNAKINLNDAWKLSIDFIKQKSSEQYEQDIKKVCLFFIVDKHYVFSSYETDKQYRVYPFSGIWVNSNTGEVFEKINGGPKNLQGLKFFRK